MKPIIKSAGTTSAERSLAELCESTFLKLWSYPNIYTPEGRKQDRGAGKELADLLVVFGDSVIIFSDKDIAFPTHPQLDVYWGRWKRRAIVASIGQLHGAEKWLKEHPGKLYLDKNCSEEFPLRDGVSNASEIHLIAVARNSASAARTFFDDETSGLVFRCVAQDETPFTYTDTHPEKTFVHILDEVRLDILLRELDTAPDFLAYLRFKTKLIRGGMLGFAQGEENLLAFYLGVGGGVASEEAVWGLVAEQLGSDAQLVINGGIWNEYSTSDSHCRRREADTISYLWDGLIDWFSGHVLSGLVPLWTDQYVSPHEAALRSMARENRLNRRFMAANFADKIRSTPRNRRSARVLISPMDPSAAFVLLIFPRSLEEPYESYRKERIELMHQYALVCKYRYPMLRRITVIGTEPQISLGRSEDLLATEFPSEMSNAEKTIAHRIMTENRILEDVSHIANSSKVDSPMVIRVPHRNQKQGRNEPCQCGSGRKHKRCCGAVEFHR